MKGQQKKNPTKKRKEKREREKKNRYYKKPNKIDKIVYWTQY